MFVIGVGGDDGTDAQPAAIAQTRTTCAANFAIARRTLSGVFIAQPPVDGDVRAIAGSAPSADSAHGAIEMTTASPPRLRIRPVRFAFRCRITPDSFCIQRSPALAVPIAKPYRAWP